MTPPKYFSWCLVQDKKINYVELEILIQGSIECGWMMECWQVSNMDLFVNRRQTNFSCYKNQLHIITYYEDAFTTSLNGLAKSKFIKQWFYNQIIYFLIFFKKLDTMIFQYSLETAIPFPPVKFIVSITYLDFLKATHFSSASSYSFTAFFTASSSRLCLASCTWMENKCCCVMHSPQSTKTFHFFLQDKVKLASFFR